MKHIKTGITQGDFNGVGLEVIIKALSDDTVTELYTPVIFADWRLWQQAQKEFGQDLHGIKKIERAADARHGQINVVDLHLDDISLTPGKPSAASGAASVKALEAAVEAIQAGEIDVLVTAPISKEACQSDSFRFAGHTEYLESKAGEEHKAQMILFDDTMKVALVTTHLPLSEIPAAITRESVTDAIRNFSGTLTRDFSITRPKIALLSLNPHVGDGGLLGKEETDIIIPAIEECINEGVLAFGAYAADGFFGSGAYRNFDGILAMYHDQGLAPFKALASEHGVNFTGGLPFVRTSPDHGTAYDIAWKGEADPQSMREAIYKAIDIFRCRARHDEASAHPLRKFTQERANKPSRQDKTQAKETESDSNADTPQKNTENKEQTNQGDQQ